MTVIETATPAIRETRAPAPAAKPLLEIRGLQMHFPIAEGMLVRRRIGDEGVIVGQAGVRVHYDT